MKQRLMKRRFTKQAPVDLGIALDYYHPYVSGLADVARVVAEGLAARGFRVEVVCGRHDPTLPLREEINGVTVRRCRVLATVDKSMIQPGFTIEVARLARRSRMLQPHLPLPEGLAAPVWKAAARRTPIVPVYHCDPFFPVAEGLTGLRNRMTRWAIDRSSRSVLAKSTELVVTSQDYLDASRLRNRVEIPVNVIPPSVPERRPGAPTFRKGDGPHVGFLGRIVAEKGLDVLLDAVARIEDPTLRVLIAGDFSRIAGGSVIDSLRDAIEADSRVELLGFVPNDRVSDFFASLDAFVLPSVNSFEAFGITQVEAMATGVPVIASDLPGVRVPVTDAGIGRLATPGDPASLARAISSVLDTPPTAEQRSALSTWANSTYSTEAMLDRYQDLLERVGSLP